MGVIQVVAEMEVHDQVEAAIVQTADLAVVWRAVHDLVGISLKYAILPHIRFHGEAGGLLRGQRPDVAHVDESLRVSCVDMGDSWRREMLCWWCEDMANAVAMVSGCVQVGGAKVSEEVLAMVSEGVQKVFS